MKIPKGFIKDSEGIYRRGSFVFKNNRIYKESTIVPKDTVEKLKDNYATKLDCIRAALAFPAIIGEEPRTTNVYIDKAGKGFKVADKFSKNTVAVVMPDRNVFDIQATDISDSTNFKDLVSEDKPVKPKELKTFGELKESYSEKLGGDPEDFISDVNDILAHIKTFDTNKLATKLAHEIVEDFEMKCEDLISMTKGKYLNESAEDNQKFWDKVEAGEIKVGDTLDSDGAGDIDILDLNKNADYILINRNKGYEPFVAAWSPEFYNGKLTWGQGHYFDNEEDAREYFNSKLNESEKLNEYEYKEGSVELKFDLIDAVKNGLIKYKRSFKNNDIKQIREIIASSLDYTKDYFDKNDFMYFINESEKLNESTKFYNTEEPDVYLELQNLKTIRNSAGKVLDVNTHGLVQNGDTVYVVTSDSDLNTIKVYSVDYQFPYVFKAEK